MDFIIREADAADYDGVCRLVKEVHRLHLKNRPDVYLDVEAPLEKAEFEALLNTEGAKIFVAEESEGRELLAYGQVEIMPTKNPIYLPKRYAYIHGFCVKSGHKRMGIGKQLFQKIVDYAKEQRADSVQLHVWEFNRDALRFYKAMGMATRSRSIELHL